MKKSKNIVLIVTPVLSAALLNACGGSQPRSFVNTSNTTPVATPSSTNTLAAQTTETRDVYNSLNDCVKDWKNKELCEQMSETDDKDYRTRYNRTGSGRYFYGPRYSSSSRIITYKGSTITPTGKVTTMPSFVSSSAPTKSTSSTSAATYPSTTSKSTTSTSTYPSTTSKSTTSTSTYPSSTSSSSSSTNPYSSSSSTRPYSSGSSSTTSPYSSSSSTTRGGFGSTSPSYSSSSRSSSMSSGS